MPGYELEPKRRLPAVAFVLLLVAGLLVVSTPTAPAQAAELDPRVPGPDNPVGPTNWNILTVQPNFVNYSSGENVTVSNVRFLSGFDITNGTHVTMRNCHVINPGSFWTVFVRDGSLLMEDCQIGDYTTPPGERGIGGNNVTLRRVKIVGHTDGIKAGHNGLYEQVWITDLREFRPDDHPDAFQDDGGNSNYTIRHSRLVGIDVNGARGTSAAIIKSDLGPISDVTIEGNFLDGGQYVLMVLAGCYGTCHPSPTNVVIRNNAFGRNAVYGVLNRDEEADITWVGNFWADNGQLINQWGEPIGGPGPGPDPDPDPDPGDGPFADVSSSHTFASEIAWLAEEGITRGCNPPSNSRFCPDSYVDRGQMAAFLVRALGLTDRLDDPFIDDDGSIFEADIEKLAAAGITSGCNPPANTKFCPDSTITRGQMAAFLARARNLSGANRDYFDDDDGSLFEDDINRLARANITRGCNPPTNDHFCPNSKVTRGQMAAFLARAFS